MAELGTTSPAGIYTNQVTLTPVSFDLTNEKSYFLQTYTTDISSYDSNDRGPTTPYLNGNGAINGVSGSSSTTYYKMRGFYTLGGVYETYIVTDAPSLSPPSGHTLTNIVVAAFWSV